MQNQENQGQEQAEPENIDNEAEAINTEQESLIPSVAEIKALWASVGWGLEKNLQEVEPLTKLSELFSIITANTLSEVPQKLSEDHEKLFYSNIIPGICRRLVQSKPGAGKFANSVAETIENLVAFLSAQLSVPNHPYANDIVSGLKHIFKQANDSAFYHQHFQKDIVSDEPSEANTGPLDFSKLEQNNVLWRIKLKQGSVIDILKLDTKYDLCMWAQGEVESVTYGEMDPKDPTISLVKSEIDGTHVPKDLKIKFLNDVGVVAVWVRSDSPDIKILGAKTYDEEWRLSLKKGDRIDALDKQKIWREATIIDPETRPTYQMPMVKVGFRTYHEQGDKEDSSGKYEGYGHYCDELMGACTVRVQKIGTYTKTQAINAALSLLGALGALSTDQAAKSIEQNKMDRVGSEQKAPLAFAKLQKQHQQDMEMLKEEGEIIYATERVKCKSEVLAKVLNLFGESRGFVLILEQVSDPESNLLYVRDLLECLQNAKDMFHHSFTQTYFVQLFDCVSEKLLKSTLDQLRAIQNQKDCLKDIIRFLTDDLLSKVLPEEECKLKANVLNSELAVQLLKTDFLAIRIEGAKKLDKLCKDIVSSTKEVKEDSPLYKSKSAVLKLIKENNVLEEFYSIQRSHQQLIMRSEGLLSLLVSSKELPEEDLEMIWKTSDQHASMTIEFYKILKSIAQQLDPEELYFFIQKVSNQPVGKLSGADVEVLEDLAVKSRGDSESSLRNQTLVMQVIFAFLFYDMTKDAAPRTFDKKYAFKATSVISEIIKSSGKEIIDKLCVVDEGVARKGALFNIWNKEFLPVPELQTVVVPKKDAEKEANPEEAEQNKALRHQNVKIKDRMSDASFFTCKILKNFLSSPVAQVQQTQGPVSQLNTLAAIEAREKAKKDHAKAQEEAIEKQEANMKGTWISSSLQYLPEMLINDLEQYMRRTKGVVGIEVLTCIKEKKEPNYTEMTNKPLSGMFAHAEHIKERLDFIKQTAAFSGTTLSIQQLAHLWRILITNNEILIGDHKIFYIWLSQLSKEVTKKETNVVAEQDLTEFFREVCSEKNDYMNYANLSIEGYACVQGFFLLCNQKARRLILLGEENDKTVKEALLKQKDREEAAKKQEAVKDQEAGAEPQAESEDIATEAAAAESKAAAQVNTSTMTNSLTIQTGSETKKMTSFSTTEGAKYTNSPKGGAAPPKGILKNGKNTDTKTVWGKPGERVDIDDIDILARVEPKAMEGIQSLWNIAIDCQDTKVNEKVVSLLLQLHTNVDFGMEDHIPQFENQFIESCRDIINECVRKIQDRSEGDWKQVDDRLKPAYDGKTYLAFKAQKLLPVEEKRIIRCLGYLSTLIYNSEKDGTHGLRPHSSLFDTEKLFGLKVNNMMTGFQVSDTWPRKVEIDIDGAMTLFDLKNKIIREVWNQATPKTGRNLPTPIHITKTAINRPGQSKLYHDIDNGKTLKEINLKQAETINIKEKSEQLQSKVPLFNDDMTDINERAIFIFDQMFKSFSVDDPDCPGRMIMGRDEVTLFVMGVTNNSKVDRDDERVDRILDNARTVPEKMLRDDFIAFYRESCFDRVDTVRANLIKYNYRQDLKQAAQDGDEDNIMQNRKGRQDMPRFKLTNDTGNFNMLTNLCYLHPEVKVKAIQLIQNSVTRPHLVNSILQLSKGIKEFDWTNIFDQKNEYHMLYSLQVVDSLIRGQTFCFDTKEMTDLQQDWIERFLVEGGFTHLLNLFREETTKPFPSDVIRESKNQLQVACLNSMLQKVDLFITAAIQSVDPGAQKKLKEKILVEAKVTGDEDLFVTKTADNTTTASAGTGRGTFIGPYAPGQMDAEVGLINEETLFGGDAVVATTQTEEGEGGVIITTNNDEHIITSEVDAVGEYDDADTFKETKRFAEIVDLLQKTKMGEKIIKEFDFTALQDFLMKLLCKVLQKKESLQKEEDAIIKSIIELWKTIVLCNPELIDSFYKWERDPEELATLEAIRKVEDDAIQSQEEKDLKDSEKTKHSFNMIRNCDDLILHGLLGSKLENRKPFKECLEAIAGNIRTNSGRRPLYYFLNLLKNNFPVSKLGVAEYFTFFDYCIQLFAGELSPKDKNAEEILSEEEEEKEVPLPMLQKKSSFSSVEFEWTDLLITCFAKLRNHVSDERSNSVFASDLLLRSYIKLTNSLFKLYKETASYDQILKFNDENKFLDEIFYENLYYIPGKTVNSAQNKCKNKDSRAAAHQLLLNYLRILKPKEMSEFLENYLQPMIESLKRPKKWRHQPSDKTKSVHAGILNLGCVCYSISMLQQMYMVPQFRYQVLAVQNKAEPNMVEYKEMMVDDNLLYQFQKMFGFLELTDRQCYDPTEFFFSFKDYGGNPTQVGIQEDSQEFVNRFFDKLEQTLANTAQKYIIDDIFRGHKLLQLVCQSCGFAKTREDTFYCLQVEVKNRQNLYDSLNAIRDGQIINDYQCDGCKNKVDVQERTLFGTMPNVLIIHEQRIVFDFETFQNSKINSQYEFPNILDLRDYSAKEMLKNANIDQLKSSSEINYDELMEKDDDEYVYRLVGINIHRGNADHGHYWSLINTDRGTKEPDPYKDEAKWRNVEKSSWRKFDDESNLMFSFNELKGDAFGGDASTMSEAETQAFISGTTGSGYGKSAYMLVYERKKKTELRIVDVPESTEKEEKEEEEDEEMEEIKTEEVVNKIPWNSFDQKVPEWLENVVKKDNVDFVIDKQVFHEQFFKLTSLILKHIADELCMTSHQYPASYFSHLANMKNKSIQVGQRVVYDLISHFKNNSVLSPISDAMTNLISFSDSPITFLVYHENDSLVLNFLQRTFLCDELQYFFNLMFNGLDTTSRFHAGRIAAKALNQAFYVCHYVNGDKNHEKVVKLRDAAEDIIYKCILKLQDRDCQKQWSRLLNYFTFLQAVCTDGPAQAILLLEKFDSVIVDIVDFCLQGKSPKAKDEKEKRVEMGGSVNTVQVGPLIALVSHIIRCKYTPQMLSYIENKPTPLPLTVQTFVDRSYESISKTVKEHFPIPQKHIITQEEIDFFTNKDLMKLILDNTYNCSAYGKALAHLCFEDEKFSRKISKFLLKGIASNDNFAIVKNYLDVVEAICQNTIEGKDSQFADLPRKRLEWIFGFGFMNAVENTDTHVFGLESTFHNLQTEIFMMKSMVTYDPLNQGCLLHQLWRYSGRNMTFPISCLETLVNIICSHEYIMEYFASLPGITYNWARYTDWIRPYCNSLIAKSSTSSDTEATCVKLLSHFEIYELFTAKRDGTKTPVEIEKEIEEEIKRKEEEQKRLEEEEEAKKSEGKVTMSPQEKIEGYSTTADLMKNDLEERKKQEDDAEAKNVNVPVIQCIPRPFMVLQGIQKTERPVHLAEKDGVMLTVSAIECLYAWSEPNGRRNKSIPANYLTKYVRQVGTGNTASNTASNTDGSKSAAAMLAERERQLEEQEGTRSVSGFARNLQTVCENNRNEDTVIKDGDDQWQIVQNEPQDDGYRSEREEMEVSAANATDGGTDVEVQSAELRQMAAEDPLAGKFQEPNQPSAQADPDFQANEGNICTENPQMVRQQSVVRPDGLNESFGEEEWEGPTQKCSDLVFKLTVQNTTESPIKVFIQLSEKVAGTHININWPRTGIKGQLEAGESSVFALLTKIEPAVTEVLAQDMIETTEINKFNIDIKWKHDIEKISRNADLEAKNKDNMKQPGTSTGPITSAPDTSTPNEVAGNEEYTNVDHGDYGDFAAGADDKSCAVCTYLNPMSASVCSMCNNQF